MHQLASVGPLHLMVKITAEEYKGFVTKMHQEKQWMNLGSKCEESEKG